MNKTTVLMIFLLAANVGCASERLYLKVIDEDGLPVTNAIVEVGVPQKTAFWGSNSPSRKGTSYSGHTNTNGEAVVVFDCQGSRFRWTVRADGYYQSNIFEESFNDFEEVVVPPASTKIILNEHEKHGEVIMYRIMSPQAMYAYSREKKVRSPVDNGRYGFDLECFDWLPPNGAGKVADFYYVRDRSDETNSTKRTKYNNSGYFLFKSGEPGFPALGEVVGRVEFDENCGAYIGKKTGCENFPSVHRVDLKNEFHNDIPITIVDSDGSGTWLQESSVIGKDEYMVIRSRVKYDEHGNIVSANYSKLIGPFVLSSSVGVDESVFNPRPNDTNLEFDPEQNLYKGKKGRGRIP